MSWSTSLAGAVSVISPAAGAVALAVTLGGQFGSVGLLRRIAPHDAIRSVAPSRLRSEVFSDSTVSRNRLSSRLLWSPSENEDRDAKVASPMPGRIDTVDRKSVV